MKMREVMEIEMDGKKGRDRWIKGKREVRRVGGKEKVGDK